MLQIKTRQDLERLIKDGVLESLTLDYKQSAALSKEEKKRDELCKDVTAFANSAGGQLVFGIEDDKHVPVRLDGGAAPEITKEWIEQVIDSRIQPRIEGLVIHPIKLVQGLGFVIDVPQALGRAPHQAPDKRYYRRQNFQNVAMEDYEVRDILRRTTMPDLQVDLSFPGGDTFMVQFGQQEMSQTFFLNCTVRNNAPTPANYAIVEVLVDHDLTNPFAIDPFVRVNIVDRPNGSKFNVFRRTIASPPGVPIFQEGVHDSHVAQIALQLSANLYAGSVIDLETDIKAPGVSKHEEWVIRCESGRLQIVRQSGRPG
jgi:schlafen family protein